MATTQTTKSPVRRRAADPEALFPGRFLSVTSFKRDAHRRSTPRLGFVAIWCQFARDDLLLPSSAAYMASTLPAYIFAPSRRPGGGADDTRMRRDSGCTRAS